MGADVTSSISGRVEAYAGPRFAQGVGNAPTTLNVTGAITIGAVSASNSTDDMDVGSGGLFNGAGSNSHATTSTTTLAYLGDGGSLGQGVVVNSGSLTVTANSADVASSSATITGGGAVDIKVVEAQADLTPTIDAHIGTNAQVTTGGSVDVEALSQRAEGHTDSGQYGGGAVDVAAAQAYTTSTPVVRGYLEHRRCHPRWRRCDGQGFRPLRCRRGVPQRRQLRGHRG